MNLFSRIAEILEAQLEELVDQPVALEETPSAILEHMQECLAAFKEMTAAAIASRSQLGRELMIERSMTKRWACRAHATLSVGNHAQARQALARQTDHEMRVGKLQAEEASARRTVEGLKTSVRKMEDRLARARNQNLRQRQAAEVAPGQAALLEAEFDELEACFKTFLEGAGD